jgi:hypothetical protein
MSLRAKIERGPDSLRSKASACFALRLSCITLEHSAPGARWRKFPNPYTSQGDLERFMDALSSIDQCFIADSLLEELPTPSSVSKTKV